MSSFRSIMMIGAFLLCVTSVTSLGVMSIDFGSEWMKVAIVKPGVPMEIALNKESKRKTQVAVFMRNGERLFGADADTAGNKYPHYCYKYFPLILGKSIDDPAVVDFQKKFPYYNLVPTERNTVAFKHPENDVIYPVEAFVAMILAHAREIASTYAEGPIVDAVITVPTTWGQVERNTMVTAAELAGIKLHHLMNTNAAVALHYGVFNRKSIESKPKNILFFDMGASQTTATIAQYQLIKGKTETAPQVSIKGVGTAPVGGLKMDLTLRELLYKKWTAAKKTPLDIKEQKTGRAMAKLLVASNKVKKVLSANKETKGQVSNLIDDEDCKVPVTRDELETAIKGDIEQAMGAVRDAFSSSAMTNDEISMIIMFGGGMRVPAIQEALKKELKGAELSFNINADESAALGGSYQAAYVSKVFRVKTLWVRDAAMQPIEVRFERAVDPADSENGESVKQIKRTLFQKMNPYPQKKAITFNRFTDDFKFSVWINNELSWSADLSGVKEAHDKYSDADAKGVKAHFRMDDSGILTLESAEATFEKEVMPEIEEEEAPKATDEKQPPKPDGVPDIDMSTLDKLKEKFGSFFNGDAKEGDAEKILEELGKAQAEKKQKDEAEKPEDDETEEVPESDEEPEEKPTEEEKAPEEEPPKTEEEPEKTADDATEDATKEEEKTEEKPEDAAEKEGEEKKDGKIFEELPKDEPKEEKVKEPPKPVLKKFQMPLNLTNTNNGLSSIAGDEKTAVYEQLKALDLVDAERLAKAKASNDLESFIYDKQDKLNLDGWTEALSEEKRESLTTLLSEASDWLWDVEDPTTVMYEDKLAELRKATREWTRRVEEHEKRPEAVERLQNMIVTMRKVFMEDYANMTGEGFPLSQEDVFQLSEKLDKAEDWLNEQLEAQKAKEAYEEPALKVLDLTVKESTLYKAGDALVKKVKYWKPPKPTTPPKNETETIEPGEPGEEEVKADEGEEVKPDGEKTDEAKPETQDEATEKETEPEVKPEGDAAEPEVKSEETTDAPEPTQEPSTHDPTDL